MEKQTKKLEGSIATLKSERDHAVQVARGFQPRSTATNVIVCASQFLICLIISQDVQCWKAALWGSDRTVTSAHAKKTVDTFHTAQGDHVEAQRE
jgi:hypothetical protein